MLKRHALSAAFPSMSQDEQAELTADIKVNGLNHPIVLLAGEVLDGWHRYQACIEIGIEPRTVDLDRDIDPVAYVIAENALRRHLTASQRALAVVACYDWAGIGTNESGVKSLYTHHEKDVKTATEMADQAGVSRQTIQHVKKAVKAGIGEAIRDGKLSAERAAEIADLPEEERAAAIEAPAPRKEKPAEPVACETCPDLERRIEEMGESLAAVVADNESMVRIFEADDRLTAAVAEAARFRELSRVLQERLNGANNQVANYKKDATRWMKKYQAQEKKEAQIANNPF